MRISLCISQYGGPFTLVHNSKNSQIEEDQDACFIHLTQEEHAKLNQE